LRMSIVRVVGLKIYRAERERTERRKEGESTVSLSSFFPFGSS